MTEDAPDTGAGLVSDDHDFAPPEHQPWGLCSTCGYGQAAHTRVPVPYRSDAPRAPEGAVRTGNDEEGQ